MTHSKCTLVSQNNSSCENLETTSTSLGNLNLMNMMFLCVDVVVLVSACRDCVKKLVALHALAGLQKLKAVYKKYSSLERGGVALLQPAKFLLA